MMYTKIGTPATTSQMAKDVVHFLAWTSDPHHDRGQLMMMKVFAVCIPLIISTFYMKRHRWSYIKSKKVIYKPPQFRED